MEYSVIVILILLGLACLGLAIPGSTIAYMLMVFYVGFGALCGISTIDLSSKARIKLPRRRSQFEILISAACAGILVTQTTYALPVFAWLGAAFGLVAGWMIGLLVETGVQASVPVRTTN